MAARSKLATQDAGGTVILKQLIVRAGSYDLAGGLLPALLFTLVIAGKVNVLLLLLKSPPDVTDVSSVVVLAASIGCRVLVICFFTLAVVLFLVRARPLRKTAGFLPKAMAIGGTFIMTLVAMAPLTSTSPAQTAIAALLLLAGNAVAALSLWTLGRSFGVLPEARRLVTSGPYALVRHPIYLGEILASCGMVLQALAVQTVVVFLVFVALQMQRMAYEEAVLLRAFPEYEEYRGRTARLIPGVM